ncbi:MAG: hypothetical protein QM708_10410 [Propioniciclava sp.]|uniref:glycosyltransferase family 2 protein n=1 Tax=Propioniciclava sp. TaxID=2038686 RepID=UPI0039E2F335
MSPAVTPLALVVTTLGRVGALRTLLESLDGQLTADDQVVLVAQDHADEVRALAQEYRGRGIPVSAITSPRGAARGRNAGVRALRDGDPLLLFPNDTTWLPSGGADALRALGPALVTGALTVIDEHGPKFTLPAPGTPVDQRTVWSVIEMGLLVRRSAFEAVGGFDEQIGTGASTPWQAGEVTDLLLRLRRDGYTDAFVWCPPEVHVRGIGEATGLSDAERRRKQRGYNRGTARLLARWHYPWWWQVAFLGAGLLSGVLHPATHRITDGWWVFLGRLEGLLGRTFGASQATAVAR